MKRNIEIKFRTIAASGAIWLVIVSTAVAYEVTTHRTMTALAALRSSLGVDANLLWRLGIGVDPDSPFLEQRLRYTDEEGGYHDVSPAYMLTEGAEREDDDPRAVNHFFNPISGIGLAFASPDWSLEPVANPFQYWSYRDMMDELHAAMLVSSEAEAGRRFANAFRALGHVVHHVQDMAQPQHARLDAHCNTDGCKSVGENIEEVYEPSFYEWLSARMSSGGFYNANGDLVVGPSDPGDYPNVRLYRPRDYWHQGAGFGMADYSNRNFVTDDTNFAKDESGNYVTTDFASPGLADWDEVTVDGATFQDAAGNPLQGDLRLIRVPVTDDYLGTGPAWTHDTASRTLFSDDIRAAIDAGVPAELFDEHDAFFYLNRVNHESANRHLFHRAIGYSAGFIDHVFRGRLEIAPPEGNIYSLVDHAVTNEVGGEVPEGFTSIKLKLRNVTAQQTSPDPQVANDGHQIKAGTLVAIALYRPNTCYEPDLSGEINAAGVIPSGCSQTQWREATQQRVVSTEITISAGDIDTVDFTEMTFDFSANPIPINARDLSIQLVFRGAIGGDLDAIAVGRKEISEPTWIGSMASRDIIAVNGAYETTEDFLVSDEAVDVWEIDENWERDLYSVKPALAVDYYNVVNGEKLTASTPLPVRGYHRLAVLTDPEQILQIRTVAAHEDWVLSITMQVSPSRTWLEEELQIIEIPGYGFTAALVREWWYTPLNSWRGARAAVIALHSLHLGNPPAIEIEMALDAEPDVTDPVPIPLLN